MKSSQFNTADKAPKVKSKNREGKPSGWKDLGEPATQAPDGASASREVLIALPTVSIKFPKGVTATAEQVRKAYKKALKVSMGNLQWSLRNMLAFSVETEKKVKLPKIKVGESFTVDVLIAALLFFIPGFMFGQTAPPLPSSSASLIARFTAFEQKTNADAAHAVQEARGKLASLLTEEANKASTGDAVNIRAALAKIQGDAREALAPSSFEYTALERAVAGYYNNNAKVSIKVDVVGKKRALVITGNQNTASTTGEIFLVREGGHEAKVGDWRKGQGNPLVFDVTAVTTKPGTYYFKFHYKDGGDEFTADKVSVQVAK